MAKEATSVAKKKPAAKKTGKTTAKKTTAAAKNNLVIVESPAKAKTIEKFLGKGYAVRASNGHLRDLPKSKIGVDVDNNFEPQYTTIRGKAQLIKALKDEAKKSKKVYLATDPVSYTHLDVYKRQLWQYRLSIWQSLSTRVM